jgi:hypothetical protein
METVLAIPEVKDEHVVLVVKHGHDGSFERTRGGVSASLGPQPRFPSLRWIMGW